MRKPFFICPPRTRSTILFESLKPFVYKNTDLLPVHGHSEPFLHTLQNKTIIDHTTGESHLMEMYPIMTDRSMDIHYIYPWVFKDNRTSILQKLKMLEQAKQNGNEYYIKGTYNLAEAMDETLKFFEDYNIIITLRHDVTKLVCSTLFATQIKMFHKIQGREELYSNASANSITISDEIIGLIKPFMDKLGGIYNLRNTLPNASIVYYEDLDTQDKIDNCISNLAGTSEWKKDIRELTSTDNKLPIKLDNDYSSLITNYDQVAERVASLIDYRFV